MTPLDARFRRSSPSLRSPGSRREFLHHLTSLAAATSTFPLAPTSSVAAPAAAVPPPTPTRAPQLENEFLKVTFDPTTGRFHCHRHDGSPLVHNAVAQASLVGTRRSTHQPTYAHTLDIAQHRDALGDARQLIVRSKDGEHQLDLELRLSLYPHQPALYLELHCHNVSPRALTLASMHPLCVTPATEGALLWSDVTKALTNGSMYYDPGRVTEFPSAPTSPLHTWWNLGLFRGYDREGLVCGHLENQTALGQISAYRIHADALALEAHSPLAPGFELAPGRSVRSGRFLLQLGPDPYTALEAYADAMGRALGARAPSILNGWCDWFFAFEHITEDEVLRNAEFAARHLLPYGLDYIQVDEGYQRWHGEWEGNDRFPHGMKWLADRIRTLGLKPGLWIAPYVISEPTDVFQHHPEWLLRHPDGRLKRVGPWPSEDSEWARNEKPHRYGLDITHPQAAQWLTRLFHTIAADWRYEMVKVDFVDWSLLSAHRYHNPGVSRAAAYRQGFELMRQALGPHCHLQDCGPGPVTVGLLDSMRIELDQNYGFRPQAWKQYFASSTGSAAAAAKRYYFHRRTWVNDADHACLALLSLPQAQAAASLLALTGGNLLSGDRLPDLDAARLEVLRKILPAYGQAARPIDLFDTDVHSAFALAIRKPFATWTVAGFFNRSETEPLDVSYPLERLALDPAVTYLAYDFWNEGLLSEVTRELRLRVPPATARIVALHARRDHPQFLSTDRHVLQGAIELDDFQWHPDTQTLTGISLGPVGTAHNLAVHLPQPRAWTQGGPVLHHDFPTCTARLVEPQILRVRVRFPTAPRVAWHVDLSQVFGKT